MAYFTSVRYGKMRMVARFKTDREDLHVRDRCVVRTDRGKELGEVLTPLQPIPDAIPAESLWDVIRRANTEDLVNVERLDKESVPRAIRTCKELVQKLNLEMKVTDVDYVYGGERLIFYFTSQSRVDFRELVRQLAHEFRTRIELKQVGARDEARLIGDAGHCGLTLCCRGHLKELGGITMDMAKIQKHTADPSKITGRCGKLLCCLRYEYTTYTDSRDVMPQRGTRLESKKGVGIVVDQNLLLREVTLQPLDGGDRFIVKLEEVLGAPAAVAGCNGCDAPKAGPAATAPAPTGEAAPTTVEQGPIAPPGATASPASVSDPVAPLALAPAPAPAPRPPSPSRQDRSRPPARPQEPRKPDTQKLPTEVQRKIEQDTRTGTRAVSEVSMWIYLAKKAEIEPGKAIVADLGGSKVAVFNVDGVFHVLSNDCGHQGGPLGEGKLEGFSVICPWHQWKFDVTTGNCLSVGGSSVRRYEVGAAGEDLFVKV
ncbi:MAG TPA: regulatory iron-sulfur-containing complex subunit RicT [Planctomycetota bacterium]|nr:regulatory iron-sulfur-containing complex subunit RicT [Planctomycetota bacterium]